MPGPSTTRRGVLAATGATLLAGCSGLDGLQDRSEATISTAGLPDVTDDGESEPVVVETVPVAIEREVLAERAQRTNELLARLPLSFGPDDVPNGHVRERLVDAADDASSHVDDARSARSRLTALQSLRRARSHARYAAAGWAYVEDGTTVEDLQSEYETVARDADAFESDHTYLGEDAVEAVLVHARIEENLDRVSADGDPTSPVDTGELLPVAEWGEHAEFARGLVDDSRYLYGRFSDSLPDDAPTVEDQLTTAGESLVDDLQRRRAELPPEPTQAEQTLGWRLRYRMRDEAESRARYIPDAPGPASAILIGVAGITDFLAYDRIVERIEGGERFGIEAAADVHDARERAVDAIRSALAESPRSALARPALADAAVTVAAADEELARLRGDVRPTRLHDPVRRYVAATARARSVSTATREALDALES